MYLMFELRRLDVWPVGDLGVRQGYGLAWGIDPPPDARRLGPLGDRFRPYRERRRPLLLGGRRARPLGRPTRACADVATGRRSAGLLLYRRTAAAAEVLIGHMGGPFWARKDEGAWSIPKGEYEDDEEPLAVALREFAEELGAPPPAGAAVELGEFRQSGGKRVTVFAREGDLDASEVRSNEFEMEWPRGSGRMQRFPEIDRAEWMPLDRARAKLVKGQVPAIDALVRNVLEPL